MNTDDRMSFVERETEDLLVPAFDWQVCKRASPAVLVTTTEQIDPESKLRAEIVRAVRRFGDQHRDDLLKLVPDTTTHHSALRRQAEAVTCIVHGVLDHVDEWAERLKILLETNPRLPVPLDSLLALVAVHVFNPGTDGRASGVTRTHG